MTVQGRRLGIPAALAALALMGAPACALADAASAPGQLAEAAGDAATTPPRR